jgi:hypothetical protein
MFFSEEKQSRQDSAPPVLAQAGNNAWRQGFIGRGMCGPLARLFGAQVQDILL